MRHTTSTFIGVASGAAAAIVLDPVAGRRRRALLTDKLAHAAALLERAIPKLRRDLTHRAHGLAAGTKHLVRRESAGGEVLVERVRSRLGRLVSHPHAIDVTAAGGRVTLAGPILASEVGRLIRATGRVQGVTHVDNRLEEHEQAGDVPALQGGTGRTGSRPELLQSNWAPAPRLLAGLAGTTLIAIGLKRGGWLGSTAALAGLAVAARGATNVELRRLLGTGGGRRAVDIVKTIWIGAPPEQVFALWTDIEQFPKLMTHVREVRDLGSGRSHWIVEGPAGANVAWDAEITEFIPNRVIAWRSIPGARVRSSGMVRFDPETHGTRLSIRLSYNPPAGALGHAVAALFGRDPKKQMDDDLQRLKSLLEVGKTSVRGRVVRVEDLQPQA